MAMLIAKEMFVDVADQYIEGEFKLMNRTNSTSMTFDVAPTSFWFYGDSQRAQYGEYGDIFTFEDQAFPDDLQPAVDPIYDETEWEVPTETNGNDTQIPYPTAIFNSTWEEVVPYMLNDTSEINDEAVPAKRHPTHHHNKNNTEKKHEHHKGHKEGGKKHHRMHNKGKKKSEDGMFGVPTDMNGWDDNYDFYGDGFDFDMSNMTEREAKNVARFWISVLCVVGFGWSAIVYLWMQALYVFAINRVMAPQKELEKQFMGPETPALPNTHHAIQTINIEQQQVQPNYVFIQPGPRVAPVSTGHIRSN